MEILRIKHRRGLAQLNEAGVDVPRRGPVQTHQPFGGIQPHRVGATRGRVDMPADSTREVAQRGQFNVRLHVVVGPCEITGIKLRLPTAVVLQGLIDDGPVCAQPQRGVGKPIGASTGEVRRQVQGRDSEAHVDRLGRTARSGHGHRASVVSIGHPGGTNRNRQSGRRVAGAGGKHDPRGARAGAPGERAGALIENGNAVPGGRRLALVPGETQYGRKRQQRGLGTRHRSRRKEDHIHPIIGGAKAQCGERAGQSVSENAVPAARGVL